MGFPFSPAPHSQVYRSCHILKNISVQLIEGEIKELERKNLMQNIVSLQDRLVKAAAAVGRGALPVLASGLQSLESSVEAVARMSRYDLVVYGASGFTGQFVV